jgi:hypothetical protein
LVRIATAVSAVFLALAACGLGACASRPATPAPGTAAVEGMVRLVPRDGAPTPSGGGSYGDRRLRDVRLVDYSKPEASVVFLDTGSRPGGRIELAAEDAIAGARLAPRFAVVGAGGEIAIENRARRDVVVSVPGVEHVQRIAPGGQWVVSADRAGPLEVFLLGAEEPARVWVSPGPWTQPDASGHFALLDLPPGHFTLRAWHPRLPSATAPVDLQAGATTTVNFEIGVGRGEGAHEAH